MTGHAAPAAAPAPAPPPRDALARLSRRALVVGLVATLAAWLGTLVDPDQVLRAWLVAVVLATGVAAGCLALVLLHLLTGGAWGRVVRRPLEAAAGTLPLLALLFVPLLAGLPRLYPWARPEQVATDPLLQHRAAWLNAPCFTARLVLTFLVWIGTALLLRRQGRRRASDDAHAPRATRRLAAPALLAWALVATSAAIDWLMSLEPHWRSSLVGIAFITGSVLSALAFVVVVSGAGGERSPFGGRVEPDRLHDLGTLLFAFVMLFAYFAFSQFLLVWSADLPEEVTFYLRRSRDGWGWVAGALALLHVAVPFALLLGRRAKRNRHVLVAVASLVLLMRWVDLQWHVAPTAVGGAALVHWIDLTALLGVAALFVAAFAWRLGRDPHPPRARAAASGEARA